jgi:hypothetical protein
MPGLGLGCAKTQSDLVVMPCRRRIFAFACTARDHRPQNYWCVYTAWCFHTARVKSRVPPRGRMSALASSGHTSPLALSGYVPCVDGSGLARTFFTSRRWSVQPCVRPVCAVHMTAGHNALRGSGPGQKPAFEMQWHKWVVLIAGSTGSALRAVRPPNLHITPGLGAISITPRVRRVACSVHPWPSSPTPSLRACWRARSQRLSLACAPTVQ